MAGGGRILFVSDGPRTAAPCGGVRRGPVAGQQRIVRGTMNDPESLSTRIKAYAHSLGFARAGILPVGPSLTHGFYQSWLAEGHAGEMGYLHRQVEHKRDPERLLPGARSLIVLAHSYHVPPPRAPAGESALHGRVSRYAWGSDYHEVLEEKLHALARFIAGGLDRELRYRAVVDSEPLMEREFAARAGLGWVGRNAMLIDWKLGSWLFLAELLVDLVLDYDEPPPAPLRRDPRPVEDAGGPSPALRLRESCGTCTACIQACPTEAIVADKTVDSRRCISYLTIELKGQIPEPLRPAIGDWVFGCDICQDVCPWNRRAPYTDEPAFRADASAAYPSLVALLAMDDAAFRARFRHTPLWRAKRRGVLRNTAIALGNQAAQSQEDSPARHEALEALGEALRDPEPLVRGAAAWALGNLGEAPARALLDDALRHETEADVREEIEGALARGTVHLAAEKCPGCPGGR